MNKKIIWLAAIALTVGLLTKPFLKLFEWDIELLSSTKQWAKIISVEAVENKIRIPGNGVGAADMGSYVNWRATVNIDDKKVEVRVLYSPKPIVGQCMPLVVKRFSKGVVVAMLDVEEWRSGTPVENCQ